MSMQVYVLHACTTFVGLPIPKIWLIFCHSIYPSGDFDLLTLELVSSVMIRDKYNLIANFGAFASE